MRNISEVASDIRLSWKNVNYAAAPYLDAMDSLRTVNDGYGFDSATSICLYFLSNATSFRGDDARRLKAELKKIIGAK